MGMCYWLHHLFLSHFRIRTKVLETRNHPHNFQGYSHRVSRYFPASSTWKSLWAYRLIDCREICWHQPSSIWTSRTAQCHGCQQVLVRHRFFIRPVVCKSLLRHQKSLLQSQYEGTCWETRRISPLSSLLLMHQIVAYIKGSSSAIQRTHLISPRDPRRSPSRLTP